MMKQRRNKNVHVFQFAFPSLATEKNEGRKEGNKGSLDCGACLAGSKLNTCKTSPVFSPEISPLCRASFVHMRRIGGDGRTGGSFYVLVLYDATVRYEETGGQGVFLHHRPYRIMGIYIVPVVPCTFTFYFMLLNRKFVYIT
jgi:hypothetical protein